MTVSLSVSWDDAKKKRVAALFVILLLLSLPIGSSARRSHGPSSPASVIVQTVEGGIADARRAVVDAGGTITSELGLIGGFVADVPAAALDGVRTASGVAAVTANAPVRLNSTTDGYDASADPGSMYLNNRVVGARAMWASGFTGAGIDVALIDSGVVPVEGLAAAGKVVHGPDLSFEAGDPDVRHLDSFGHGTHMAGIIAGRDDAATRAGGRRNSDNFVGIAPDARIVSIKVADAVGSTDISRVIAGIAWAVVHRNDDGLNIRVLNLSFGRIAVGNPALDPLVQAVDAASDAGIVVVVSAGNRGAESDGVDTPGRAADVITVAADDAQGTPSVDDDAIPAWSSRGDGERNPDLVAPGTSIVSLRDPESYIDQQNPSARVGTRFFRGSGTSASTAMVTGSVALLLQQRPHLTPRQVKAVLMSSATPLPGVPESQQGAGLVNLRAASSAPAPMVGLGSVDLDLDVPPTSVLAPSMTVTASGNSWSGNSWSGNSWSGQVWAGNSWSGNSWSLMGEESG